MTDISLESSVNTLTENGSKGNSITISDEIGDDKFYDAGDEIDDDNFYDAGENITHDTLISKTDVNASNTETKISNFVVEDDTILKSKENCSSIEEIDNNKHLLEDMDDLSTEVESSSEESSTEVNICCFKSNSNCETKIIDEKNKEVIPDIQLMDTSTLEESKTTSNIKLTDTNNLEESNVFINNENTEKLEDNELDYFDKSIDYVNEDNAVKKLHDSKKETNNVVNEKESSPVFESRRMNKLCDDDLPKSYSVKISDVTRSDEKNIDITENEENKNDKLIDKDTRKYDHEIEFISVDDDEEEIIDKEKEQEQEVINDEYFLDSSEKESVNMETNAEEKKITYQKNETKENISDDNDLFKEDISVSQKSKGILKEVNCDSVRMNKDDLVSVNEKLLISDRFCQVVIPKINFDEYISMKETLEQTTSIELEMESMAKNVSMKRRVSCMSDSSDEILSSVQKKCKLSDDNEVSNEKQNEINCTDSSSGTPLIKYVNSRKRTRRTKSYREKRSKRKTKVSSSSEESELVSPVRKSTRKIGPPYVDKLRKDRNKNYNISSPEASDTNKKIKLDSDFSGSSQLEVVSEKNSKTANELCASSENKLILKKKSLIGVFIPRIDEILNSNQKLITKQGKKALQDCDKYYKLDENMILKQNFNFDEDSRLDSTVKILQTKYSKSQNDVLTDENTESPNKAESNVDEIHDKIILTSRSKNRRITKIDDKTEYLKKLVELCGLQLNNYDEFWKNCKSYKSKFQRIYKFLKENGLKGYPTEKNCKSFGLQRRTIDKNNSEASGNEGIMRRITRSSVKSFTKKKQKPLKFHKR